MVTKNLQKCEICDSIIRIWGKKELCVCKECGRAFCNFCRRIYFRMGVKKITIHGKDYTLDDLNYCKECGKEWDCEYCKEYKTEAEWNAFLKVYQEKHELRELPYKSNYFDGCFFCGKLVCDLHSTQIDGVFQKYGIITVCISCLEKQKCVKCGNNIVDERYNRILFNKKHELTCSNCHRKISRRKHRTLEQNYEKHSNFQIALRDFFRKGLGCSVTLERGLKTYASIDMVIVNPKTYLVYGMEIKTGKVTKEIVDQLAKYTEYFDYFYVVVKAKYLQTLLDLIDKKHGIFLLNDAETQLSFVREAQRNLLTKDTILKLIKPYPLRWITIEHQFGIKPTALRKMKPEELSQIVGKRFDETALREIYADYVLGKKYGEWFSITNREYFKKYPQFSSDTRSKRLDEFFPKGKEKDKIADFYEKDIVERELIFMRELLMVSDEPDHKKTEEEGDSK